MSFIAVEREQLSVLYPTVGFAHDVTIGENVAIGSGSIISAGVRLYPMTKLGANVTVLENTVIGRPTLTPTMSSTVKRQMADDVEGTVVGDNSIIGACCVLYRGSTFGQRNIICDLTSVREHCHLGDDVLLGRGVMLQVGTQVGDRTKVMDTCHLPGDMVVGVDVFMSTHVCGASENSLGRTDSTGRWTGPTIRDRAYIGVNATLLPGVEIGEDAVVGAGAMVTKDVAPATLVMGVPARFVRVVEPLRK